MMPTTDQISHPSTSPLSNGMGNSSHPAARAMKYIVIIGGTMSGLGKGVAVSSLGALLRAFNFKVTAIKIDPYLNTDAGTMSPFEHGEVFVLDDGGEVDLDLGNYERSFGAIFTNRHNITTGKIYKHVLEAERRGEYLGSTVQVVPHVTDTIQEWITEVSYIPIDGSLEAPDVCLIEIGGTVGDIESAVYLEAMQQFITSVGFGNICLCFLSYVPMVGRMLEQKTKPTQHGAKELCRAGLKPDFIFCRSKLPLSDAARQKVALFTQVAFENVISLHDVEDLNEVPKLMNDQKLAHRICKRLNLNPFPHMAESSFPNAGLGFTWTTLLDRKAGCEGLVTVGIVGKYMGFPDSYLSVVKALEHAALEAKVNLQLCWIDSSDLEYARLSQGPEAKKKYKSAWEHARSVDAIVCPGGFGDRGVLGKSLCARLCRTTDKPFLGICLGMQLAIIDFARDVLKLEDADSEEFNDNTPNPVIISMPEHTQCIKGGTMRLGKRTTILQEGSLVHKLYDGCNCIEERHRHRYEVNPLYVKSFESHGFKFVGQDTTCQRMEVAELEKHRYFVCVQFHPEFKSRPFRPAPVFLGLILAAKDELRKRFDNNSQCLMPGLDYENLKWIEELSLQAAAV